MDIKHTLGRRIQDYRKKKDMTQEHLAEIIGIDTMSLSKIETGKNYPTAENLSKIAAALDTQVYELFVEDVIKSNEILFNEITAGIQKISKNNEKLHVLNAVVNTLAK